MTKKTTQTLASLLPDALMKLRQAGVADPAGDARRLLAFAAHIPYDRLTLCLHDSVTLDIFARFKVVLDRRIQRQPVSQIIGERCFFGHFFDVTSDVLDPRPETETLILAALQQGFQRVLDIGTGSGCIVLTLLAHKVGASGVGVDISAKALAIAKQNAVRLHMQDSVAFVQSDWFSMVQGCFDLIVSNPPYIDDLDYADLDLDVRLWEPRIALTLGGDGLDPYRLIAVQAPDFLTENGCLLLEIGPKQGQDVVDILEGQGWRQIHILPDMDGRDRVVQALRPVVKK